MSVGRVVRECVVGRRPRYRGTAVVESGRLAAADGELEFKPDCRGRGRHHRAGDNRARCFSGRQRSLSMRCRHRGQRRGDKAWHDANQHRRAGEAQQFPAVDAVKLLIVGASGNSDAICISVSDTFDIAFPRWRSTVSTPACRCWRERRGHSQHGQGKNQYSHSSLFVMATTVLGRHFPVMRSV